jgi:hypothetical protein
MVQRGFPEQSLSFIDLGTGMESGEAKEPLDASWARRYS